MSEEKTPGSFSRRSLLGSGSLLGGFMLVGCAPKSDAPPDFDVPPEADVEAPLRGPVPPDRTPRVGVYEFFTRSEAQTVEAVAARIIPGDELDPGAREAEVTNYIDHKLARFEFFAEPTYLQPPFAEGYQDSPPQGLDDVVLVPQEELYRYGYQSGLLPPMIYREGLSALNRYAENRFGAPFVELSEDRQDTVLQVLNGVQQRSAGGGDSGGNVPPAADLDIAEGFFGEASAGTFFSMIRTDTLEGMFSDPIYGGNRGLVGWTLIGFPGPQRSYSPQELKIGTDRRPQSLDGLEAMNPGRHQPHGIDPMQKGLSGGDRR